MTALLAALSASLVALPVGLYSQEPVPPKPADADTAALPLPEKPPGKAPPPPALNFSGVLYANFQYRGDQGPARSANKFDLERAYLTFRMPVGDRGSVRVTADVFQQQTSGSDAYYRGWTVRAKYAYFQYDVLKTARWNGTVRTGLLQTVVIEQVENFWPRWLSSVAAERAGFFASADAGIAGLILFPNKLGEMYATITNGPGYTSREIDRFKDYAGRITLTPFGGSDTFLRSVSLTGWTYRGATASRFVAGGAGQAGPVGSSLARNRSGVFAGLRTAGVTMGAEYATRTDGSESGDNTPALPRAETDSTGRLVSAFTVLRPFQMVDARSTIPLGLVGRWDRFEPNRNAAPYSTTVIAGIIWDLNKRASVALDYQEQTPHRGLPVVPTKIYFLHLVASY